MPVGRPYPGAVTVAGLVCLLSDEELKMQAGNFLTFLSTLVIEGGKNGPAQSLAECLLLEFLLEICQS